MFKPQLNTWMELSSWISSKYPIQRLDNFLDEDITYNESRFLETYNNIIKHHKFIYEKYGILHN